MLNLDAVFTVFRASKALRLVLTQPGYLRTSQ